MRPWVICWCDPVTKEPIVDPKTGKVSWVCLESASKSPETVKTEYLKKYYPSLVKEYYLRNFKKCLRAVWATGHYVRAHLDSDIGIDALWSLVKSHEVTKEAVK